MSNIIDINDIDLKKHWLTLILRFQILCISSTIVCFKLPDLW